MADKRLIPDGIRDASTEAFNELIERLGSLDLTPLLIYIIDNVSSSALPHLAEQFHVTGLEGWEFARTEAEKRSLIKKAIELHRYKGTPWAVKEALKAIGYKSVEITEGFPYVRYDGTYTYAGTEDYLGGVRWALFSVLLDLGETKALSSGEIEKIVSLINEYKNVRSHLKDITFKATIEDYFDELIDNLYSLITAIYSDIKPWGLRYDGLINYNQAQRRIYDGSLRYNSTARYDEWLLTGKMYDNEWDVLEEIGVDYRASDLVDIRAYYDGKLKYSGFSYGFDTPFAVDVAMPIEIRKHIRHNGKYSYGGIYYNNAFRYDASESYYGGIYYAGDIVTEEAVL